MLLLYKMFPNCNLNSLSASVLVCGPSYRSKMTAVDVVTKSDSTFVSGCVTALQNLNICNMIVTKSVCLNKIK